LLSSLCLGEALRNLTIGSSKLLLLVVFLADPTIRDVVSRQISLRDAFLAVAALAHMQRASFHLTDPWGA